MPSDSTQSTANNSALRQTTPIEDAAARLGYGRTVAYQLARRNELPVPVLRAGRRLVVPVAALDRALGLEATADREPVAA